MSALKRHPFWQNPTQDYEALYESFDQYLSLLVFLRSCGEAPSSAHYETLGNNKLPKLNNHYLSDLLEFFLYEKDSFFKRQDRFVYDEILQRLQEASLLFKKKIYLEDSKEMAKYLSQSSSKMKAINDIVEMECQSDISEGLSFLVLTDYIQADSSKDEDESILGVVPIFESLIKKFQGKIAERIAIAALAGVLQFFRNRFILSFHSILRIRI